MALFQSVGQSQVGGGIYMNDLAGCIPCTVDTTPSCTFDGRHNVPDATVPCPPFSVTGHYYLEDYINTLQGAKIPVRKVFTERRGILNFLMDLKTSMDTNGKMTETAVFKELKGVEVAEAVDGTFYQRGEWYYTRAKFHVTQNYTTPTNTIQVGIETAPGVYTPSLGGNYDVKGRGMLEVGDTVRIFQRDPNNLECCANEIIKTIVAVDPVNFTITLEPTTGGGPSAFVFAEGDQIEFAWHSRNDCELVTKEFGMIPPIKRVSYIHHLDNIIKFTKRELNTSYYSFEDAQRYVQNKLFHLNNARIEQMGYITYFGRNRRMSAAGQPTKGETEGIISAIRSAQIRNPDKSLIVDMSGTVNDDDRVRIIYNHLLKIQDSGWLIGNEPVVMLMNSVASAQMTKMHRAWNNLLGVSVNRTEITNKLFTYPIIETPTGISVINAYCEHLSYHFRNEGVIIMFPKSAIALYTRKNQKVVPNSNGQGFTVQQAEITSTFEDVSLPTATECREYRIMLEFSQFNMGVDSGAFVMIKGLNEC